jgi:predicted alpha-1,2-mannosidase
MLSRRNFLQTLSLATGAMALPATNLSALSKANPSQFGGQSGQTLKEDLTSYVNVKIGTGGHGHTFPGATVPFGAVQLSPDTNTKGWDWCAGYHDSDTSIMGFSHTHLSGTGCGDMLDVLLMPGVGAVKLNPGSRENPGEGYRSRYSHQDEHAEPGYYSVLLKDSGILAELTATERVGLHRYSFPASDTAHFILDFEHSYDDPSNPVSSAELEVEGDMICGSRTVQSWAGGRVICFAMEFSEPFEKVELVQDEVVQSASINKISGKSLKAVLHYRPSKQRQVLVRCGISGVSVENAKKNLRAELPHWDFNATRKAAKEKWQKELSRVYIETTDAKQRNIFYTSFYHMMVAPTLFDDVDGSYRGMDGNIHQLDSGQHNFSTFSFWDTYRALHPAFTLVQPERVPQFVNCIINMAEQSPAGMPVWPLQGKETGTMTGYHSACVIAEACVKGFEGVDWNRAYKVMRKRNMEDNYRGLGLYRDMGYIPADKEEESVSKTIEYDYDDWACSHVADKIGAHRDAGIQRGRAANYRHLFDAKSKFLRAKMSDGQWALPFDPIAMGHIKKYRDYTESNAWQTTFGIQHDNKAYMELWGGREAFVEKLDQLFVIPSTLPDDAPPDIAGLVGQYAHGNEPSHHIAYLYVYAGQPWKTQKRVHSLLLDMYDNQPDGLQGNEDCGQMSAWYFMSALGLYAVDPVSGNYVLTAPLFDKATLSVSSGGTLTIEARRSAPDATYIQSVVINGKQSERLWVSHREIAHGGSIVFILGTQPNTRLGAGEDVAPPSLEL